MARYCFEPGKEVLDQVTRLGQVAVIAALQRVLAQANDRTGVFLARARLRRVGH